MKRTCSRQSQQEMKLSILKILYLASPIAQSIRARDQGYKSQKSIWDKSGFLKARNDVRPRALPLKICRPKTTMPQKEVAPTIPMVKTRPTIIQNPSLCPRILQSWSSPNRNQNCKRLPNSTITNHRTPTQMPPKAFMI